MRGCGKVFSGRGTNLCKGPGVRVIGMFGEWEELGFVSVLFTVVSPVPDIVSGT